MLNWTQSSGWSCKAMLHLPAGFSISMLLGITTDGTPDSKEDLKARGNKTRLKKKKRMQKAGLLQMWGKKCVFNWKKGWSPDGRRGYSGCWNISRSFCLHSSKNPSQGFHQEGQTNHEIQRGVFSRRSGAGYNNLLPAQSKEFLFCAAIAAVWVFDAKDFWRKTGFFFFSLIRKTIWKMFQVFLTQFKHFSWPIWKHLFLGQFFINFSLPWLPHCLRGVISTFFLSFSPASSFLCILQTDLVWEDAMRCPPQLNISMVCTMEMNPATNSNRGLRHYHWSSGCGQHKLKSDASTFRMKRVWNIW